MRVGDLVQSKGFEFGDYGVGIILEMTVYGGIKVYWPKEAAWCYTGIGGVKPL